MNHKNETEKHAIVKGGFYASLSGKTKPYTILIVILILLLIAVMFLAFI